MVFYAYADFSKGITFYYSVALFLLVFWIKRVLEHDNEAVRLNATVLFSIFVIFPTFYWIRYNGGHFSLFGHVFPINPIGFLWHSGFALAIWIRGLHAVRSGESDTG